MNTPVVIHVDNPGWHDVAPVDVDGDGDGDTDGDTDGDIDLVSKVWNAAGPKYHVDYWRNDIREPTAD